MSSGTEAFVLAQAETESPAEEAVTGTEPETGQSDLGQILAEEIQSEVGAHPDEHGSGMPQLNAGDYAPQLVWLAISFVALYLLMARVALPRIATVLENRRDRIASDLDTAARLRQETDEVIAAYEQELAEARGKAHEIASETRDRLKSELSAERAAIEAEIADKTAEAEASIHAARQKAMGEVDAVARETAVEIVQALIGAKPTAKELDEAVKAARAR